jgi:drug/metabolite transporter (DMT)-like permease
MRGTHGYVLIAAASALWGTMGILARLSYDYGILPEVLIALRLVISSATLLFVLALFSRGSLRIQKSDALLFVAFGIFAVALQRISYFYAVNLTTATMAAILFFTYPIFVSLSALFLFKEKITVREVAAIALTFLGAALVVKAYDRPSLSNNLVGIMFGVLSSLFFVLYFMMAKKFRDKYTSWTLTLYGDAVGALALTPIISLSVGQVLVFPWQLWLLILAIAWVPSLLAYLLYSQALKHVKSSKAGILGVIEPLTAALLSAMLLGENLESPQIIGIVLALTGVTILFQARKAAS